MLEAFITRRKVAARAQSSAVRRPSGMAPQKYVFEGAIQYFAGQRHRLLKLKTPATLNWFSMRARFAMKNPKT